MAAGAWTTTYHARANILNGTFDFDTDTYVCQLFTSSSDISVSSTTLAGVSNEVASGGGYTTGGISIGTMEITGTSTQKVTETGTTMAWTGSGSGFTARFAAIGEASGDVVCFCLLDNTPADYVVASGETLTITPNASGIFTLTQT